jgi:hypothetical protein
MTDETQYHLTVELYALRVLVEALLVRALSQHSDPMVELRALFEAASVALDKTAERMDPGPQQMLHEHVRARVATLLASIEDELPRGH